MRWFSCYSGINSVSAKTQIIQIIIIIIIIRRLIRRRNMSIKSLQGRQSGPMIVKAVQGTSIKIVRMC